jgi:hypothetical protein
MKTVRPLFCLVLVLVCASASAKDQPAIVQWPETGTPVLRFSFNKFSKIGSGMGQSNYAVDVAVENLGAKRISRATFQFFLFDKNKVRIGQGYIDLSNVSPHETVKFQVNALTLGVPATVSVTSQSLPPELETNAPPKMVSMTVYSVPSGAVMKVDGKEVGPTPAAISMTVGSHRLEFAKEGYNSGIFPLVITADQVSGGTVTYELGASAHDTVELRDGTVLSGDVETVNATKVEVRVGGQIQSFDRNNVKRISLVPRGTTQ